MKTKRNKAYFSNTLFLLLLVVFDIGSHALFSFVYCFTADERSVVFVSRVYPTPLLVKQIAYGPKQEKKNLLSYLSFDQFHEQTR